MYEILLISYEAKEFSKNSFPSSSLPSTIPQKSIDLSWSLREPYGVEAKTVGIQVRKKRRINFSRNRVCYTNA